MDAAAHVPLDLDTVINQLEDPLLPVELISVLLFPLASEQCVHKAARRLGKLPTFADATKVLMAGRPSNVAA